ncbi:phage head closure protein [Sulfurimonas sp. HSL-1716]|uniref:phage head closure protein n=1 Tax=Hydrocurvibacter sulfurireducens TaxID=3131937 RepID=UPI0031F91BF6
MRSGNLKHKVEIKQHTGTRDTFGGVADDDVLFATVYVSIVPLSGKEYFVSKSVNSEVTHQIEMRFIPGVTPDMKIVYGTREFDINSVINVREANKTLQIMATEVTSG